MTYQRRVALLACLALAAPLWAEDPKPRLTISGHTGEVRCVAFSPDGKMLAAGDADNTIRFWDASSGKEQAKTGKVEAYGVSSVAFSLDGKTLAAGAAGGKISLWDVGSGKKTSLWDKSSQYAEPTVLFSPDGKTLVSGGRCIRDIRLWDPATGKETAKLEGHDEHGARALSFTPDGKTLISVGHDGKIKHWDLATGKNTVTLKIAKYTPAAAVSPDGKTVATAISVVERKNDMNVETDNSVRLWDAVTGKDLATLKAADVTVMVFSPDGKTLATGNEETSTVLLWDVATGKELATLKGHDGNVAALTFSADGKQLASGSADKTIKLWDLPKRK